MWTRKRTVIGGKSTEGDWLIYRHRQNVGRVYPAPPMPGTQAWLWGTRTYPCDSGRADTMEAALDAVREAVRARWPDEVETVPMSGT